MKFETLQKDMIAAMKAKDKFRKETISALVSAAKLVAINEGKRDDIPEEIVDKAIMKEHKSAKEQYDTCPDDRAELKEEYKNRMLIIEEYMPKMLSEEEIREMLSAGEFAALAAAKNKGAMMKAVMPVLKGKADGKLINKVVEELCR